MNNEIQSITHRRMVTAIFLCFIAGSFASGLCAQTSANKPGKKLRVATRHVPPFAIRQAEGVKASDWSGISVDLWRDIAQELDLEYTPVEMSIDEMFQGLQSGEIDVAVAALTMTSEREDLIDFTHPFMEGGLGIAARFENKTNLGQVASRLMSPQFIGTLFLLLVVLMLIGLLMWLFERRKNPEQFGGGLIQGMSKGLWFSAVTMTTVGYGDKSPKTVMGRVVALIWMFVGIVAISAFTAAFTSALTVSQLAHGITGVDDLPGKRVAVVSGSTGESFLAERGLWGVGYETAEEALAALEKQEVEAMVYDAPILKYMVTRQRLSSIHVLAETLNRESYGLALAENSPYMEQVNRLILKHTSDQAWQATLSRYLGQ